MARAIDGELLELEIANIANKLAKSDAQKALMGRVMYCVEHMPTLTPPNEWVNRVRELDELYTKLQIVTGFTAEQLLEIFAAGYTLEKPDYSKKFAEMENLAEAAQPNEPLTLGLVDKYGAPLYAGDTVAADKFFMYAILYGSHNVNPKQCEPAYQVGWYLEIVWALYNEDKTYIGHTEALYDIGGVAARYPAHCADTTEGVQNLLLYKHRPPEVSP
jgi:hypothetical protein